MAKVDRMPSQAIIDGYKGTLDYYLYKGIVCVRKWPVWRPRQPYVPEKANQDAFAYINKIAGSLPEYIIQQYKDMAQGTSLTWKDILVRAYMKGMDY